MLRQYKNQFIMKIPIDHNLTHVVGTGGALAARIQRGGGGRGKGNMLKEVI